MRASYCPASADTQGPPAKADTILFEFFILSILSSSTGRAGAAFGKTGRRSPDVDRRDPRRPRTVAPASEPRPRAFDIRGAAVAELDRRFRELDLDQVPAPAGVDLRSGDDTPVRDSRRPAGLRSHRRVDRRIGSEAHLERFAGNLEGDDGGARGIGRRPPAASRQDRSQQGRCGRLAYDVNAPEARTYSSSSGWISCSTRGARPRLLMIRRAHAFQRRIVSSLPPGRIASARSYQSIACRSQS
jgi:hypothetical protein